MLPVALLPVVLLLVVLPEEALLLCLCLPVVLVELLPVEQEVRLPVVLVVKLLLKNCVVIISGILPQKSLIQKIRKKNLKMMKRNLLQQMRNLLPLLQQRKHLLQKLAKKPLLLLKWLVQPLHQLILVLLLHLYRN
jgi:hypothetical protein